MSRIAYVVHNLNDSAVVRRVAMFRAGGAEVVVAGFCRDAVAPSHVGGAPAVMLGHTRDAALAQRAARVLGVVARPAGLLEACRGADVIVARNLEALVPAVLARRRLNIGRLVYESLDIHRSLLGKGALPAIMRWIERRLTARADALIYSSPAFSRNYFTPVQHFAMPMLLVENKLLCLDAAPGEVPSPNAPPWRIGWFGNLRCKQTLRTLAELARNSEGRVEILIAGKASPAEFPDFVRQVDQPGLRYFGPYTPGDLPALYGQCHFAWAIDYFEEGLNSSWLLPNRLYEAAAFGVVPIALSTVETGHWLATQHAGLLLPEQGHVAALRAVLEATGPEEYSAMHSAIAAISRADLIADRDDCRELVTDITAAC